MTRWTIALFAVAGAFLVAGVLGSIVFDLLGLWELPGAGFAAALGVVGVAYLAAPRKNLGFSALCFVLGAAIAWRLVGHEFYPESYENRAYEPTLLPFAATCLGGLLNY